MNNSTNEQKNDISKLIFDLKLYKNKHAIYINTLNEIVIDKNRQYTSDYKSKIKLILKQIGCVGDSFTQMDSMLTQYCTILNQINHLKQ